MSRLLNIITSMVTRFALFMAMYWCFSNILYLASRPFRYYTEKFIWFSSSFIPNSALVIIILFVGGISFTTYIAGLVLEKRRRPAIVDSIDFLVLTFLCLLVIPIASYIFLTNRSSLNFVNAERVYYAVPVTTIRFILYPFVAYSSCVVWFGSLVRRIKTKSNTMYLTRFIADSTQKVFIKVVGIVCIVLIAAMFVDFMLFYRSYVSILVVLVFSVCLSYFANHLYCVNKVADYVTHKAEYEVELPNKLKLIRDAFDGLSESQESAVEEKLKSERFKTELITNVSHDIKTPLTSLINYVDLIKKLNLDNDELNKYANIMDEKSQRLKVLIEDLMEASKVGTGNVKCSYEKTNFVELIGQLTGELDERFNTANLMLILKCPNEQIYVYSDGRHLWRILENIFINTTKYSLEGTRVYASIETEHDYVIFVLQNVSKEQLGIEADSLMAQFVRGDESRNTEGSGLGLYIAKSLAELIGADFKINIRGDLFEVVIKMKILQID